MSERSRNYKDDLLKALQSNPIEAKEYLIAAYGEDSQEVRELAVKDTIEAMMLLAKKVTDLERQLKEAKSEAEQWKMASQATNDRKIKQYDELQQQLQEANERHQAALNQLELVQKRESDNYKRLQSELAQLRQERDDLEKHHDRYHDDNYCDDFKKVEAERDTLRAEVETLQAQVNDWQNELLRNLCETEPEIVALRNRVQKLEKALTTIRDGANLWQFNRDDLRNIAIRALDGGKE